MLNGIEAGRIHPESLDHSRTQTGKLKGLQQPQDLNIFAPTLSVHPRLHQVTQGGELLRPQPCSGAA